MATKKAEVKESKKANKRPVSSFKDVQIAYLMGGVDAVNDLLKGNKASKSTIRRALRDLQSSGKDVDAFERWVIENVGALGRGRSAPSSGEVRTYKAQQVKAGGPFLRLPLDVLGIQKGGVIRVRFDADQIVVTK